MLTYILLLSCAITGSLCSISFKYSDCNDQSVEVLHVDGANLNPYPVVIPGQLSVNLQFHLLHNISSNTKAHLTIKRHLPLLGYTTIPCVSDVGSCEYDLCAMLDQGFKQNGVPSCPKQLIDSNLPCTCPFSAKTYTLQPSVFDIPELSGIFTVFASGDYKVHATLTENGNQVACYDVAFTLDHACSGFSCIFG